VLCNDSTLLLEADRDLASAPSDVASAGDIELGGTETTADKPSATENDKLALETGGRGWAVEGDPTERCIVELAALSDAPQAIKQLMIRNPRLAEVPFDSATKYMATMHILSPELLEGLRATGYSAELPTGTYLSLLCTPRQFSYLSVDLAAGEEGRVVYVKGAPEKVLSFCFDEADVRPEIVNARASWLKHAESLAGQGMRVLGLAYRVFPADHELGEALPPATLHLPEDVFVMSAMVGIIDPPRAEAIVAVKAAQDAGIIVKMITGDHPVTAYAIGRQLGLQVDRGRGITGTELDEITIRSMAELDDCVVQNDVFARTTPEHKLRIVESLRRQGYVCSMTGDGVNDAPALKAANIGVAMGITGTEVAKEAAHMIITDDNFATIVEAIRMGRCTYANLIKIIAFVLPTNGGQAFSIIGALIIDVQVPITALQILWVNMITSVTLGVVLAFDKPDRHILEDAPRGPHKPIFGKFLTWRVFTVTIFLILLVLGIFHWEKHRRNDLEYLRTCSVNALVTAQIGYIFSCRDLRRNTDLRGLLCGNRVFYLGIFAITACQVLFTYSPGFQYVFKTKPLDGEPWGKIILLAVVVFLAVELDKFLNRQRKRLLGWCCGAPTSRALQSPLYSPVVGGGRVRTRRTGRGGREEASMVVRSTFDGTEEGDGFVRRRSLDDGRRSMNTSIYNMAS
jgi:magnesium-transporting ATPase (P-type)